MKPGVVAAVVMMVIAAACLLIMSGDYSEDPDKEYTIEYILDGGSNGDNPASYRRGDAVEFEDPVRDGYLFKGWFSDSKHTSRMLGIGAKDSGNRVLYAAWEPCRTGTGFRMDVAGTDSKGTGISGSFEYRFMRESGGDHFAEVKKDFAAGPSVRDSTEHLWMEASVRSWTMKGSETIMTADGEKECSVHSLGCTTRWISDGVIYREVFSSSDMRYTAVYAYRFVFVPEVEWTVSGVQSDGIVSYTGTGTYRPGEDVIVGAVLEDGYILSGWQVDGKPFARSTDVVISGLHEDTDVRAVAVASSAEMVDVWSTVTVSDGSGTPSTRWTIADAHNGDSPVGAAVGEPATFVFTIPGEYRITNGDTGMHRYMIADGDISGTVTFAYGRTLSTVTWTVPFSHYAMYKDDAAKRAHTDHDSDSMFITWMDGDIRALADTITGRVLGHAPANSEESLLLADATLAFTQYAVRYQSDKEAHGATEYWKYPIETLVDGKGDCEDSAALFTALTAAMGLDSLMILHLPSAGDGHAFSGIAADADGVSYSIDGKKYLYCETTGIGYTVGIMPDGKRYIATRVIHPMRAR